MSKRIEIDPKVKQERLKAYFEIRDAALAKLRKRHAGFMEIVKGYTSFGDFLHDWKDKMTLFGVEVFAGSVSIDVRIQIDYSDYEEYSVIMGKDGHWTMSAAVWWQDMCANTLTDIFTGEDVEIEDIVNCFPPVSDSETR